MLFQRRLFGFLFVFICVSFCHHAPTDLGKGLDFEDLKKIRVVIDGVFYELSKYGGIGTFWRHVIRTWQTDPQYQDLDLFFIQRKNSQVPFPDMLPDPSRRVLFEAFSFDERKMAAQKKRLGELVKQLNADVFLSTYHSHPGEEVLRIPFIYDLIPLYTGLYLEQIPYILDSVSNSRYIVTNSQFTFDDFHKQFPYVLHPQVEFSIVYPMVQSIYKPYSSSDIQPTLNKYNIDRPYFLAVQLYDNHKNCKLVADFLNEMTEGRWTDLEWFKQYDIVVVSGTPHCLPSSYFERFQVKYHQLFELPIQDLAHLYAGAYALLFPSLHEGFGMPIVEAFASQTPVVLQRTSVLPEVAADAGFYYERNETHSFVQALQELNNDSIRLERVQKGLKIAEKYHERYAPKQIADLVRKIYNEKAKNNTQQ